MDKKISQGSKIMQKGSRCSEKHLGSNEVVVEKPLSPILHKSKYSRRVVDRRQNRRNIQKELEKQSDQLTETESKCTEKRSSAIPIPVKDANQFEFKKPTEPVTKQSKPSKMLSELIEFKNDIINNCAKSSNIPTYKTKFQTASGKTISISESKIKKYSDIFADILKTKNKTESDLKELKVKQKSDLKSQSKQPKPHNVEYKCASGDLTDEPTEFEFDRNKHTDYTNRMGIVDMLYENHRFDSVHISKTTVGFESLDSLQVIDEVAENAEAALNVFSNKNYVVSYSDSSKNSEQKGGIAFSQGIESITDSQLSRTAETVEKTQYEPYFNDFFGDNISQLNYNITPDESNYILKQSRHTLDQIDKTKKSQEEALKMSTEQDVLKMSTQEDKYFSNLTQNINTELEKQMQKKKRSLEKKILSKEIVVTNYDTITNDEEFAGFSQCIYERSLKEYKKHKSMSKNHNKHIEEGFEGFDKTEIKSIMTEYERYKTQMHDLEKELKNDKKVRHKKDPCKSPKPDGDILKPVDCNKNIKIKKKRYNNNKNPHDVDYHLPVSKRLKYNSKASLDGTPEGNSIPRIYTPRTPLFCSGKKLKLFARTLTQKINSGRSDDDESLKKVKHNNTEVLNIEEPIEENAYQSEKSFMDNNSFVSEKLEYKEIAKSSDYGGFSTASGKSIKISTKGMRDAMTMFNDEIAVSNTFKIDDTKSVSLSPNNRVQICIGNNKIRINIKSNDVDSMKPIIEENINELEPVAGCSKGKELAFSKESEYLKEDFINANHFCNLINTSNDSDMVFKPDCNDFTITPNSEIKQKIDESHSSLNRKYLKPKSAMSYYRPSSKESSLSNITTENSNVRNIENIANTATKYNDLDDQSKPIETPKDKAIFEFGKSKENINFVFNSTEFICASDAPVSVPTKIVQNATNLLEAIEDDQSTSKTINSFQDFKNYHPETVACYQMLGSVTDKFDDQTKHMFNRNPTYDLVNNSVASHSREDFSKSIGEAYYAPFAVPFAVNPMRETEQKYHEPDNFALLTKVPDRNTSSSNEVMEKHKHALEIMDDSTSGYNSSVNKSNTIYQNSFSGFSKASGKKILVSNTAMENAKKLFDNVEDSFKTGDHKTLGDIVTNKSDKSESNSISKSSDKNIASSNEAKAKSGSDNEDYSYNIFQSNSKLDPNSNFKSTQTGGFGGYLKDALQKENSFVVPATRNSFAGFSSPLEKNMKISHEMLRKTKNIGFNLEFDKARSGDSKKCGFTGFSNASGKPLNISKDALDKAKTIFDNIDSENIYNFDKPDMFSNVSTKGSNEKDVNHSDGTKVSKTAHELIEDVVNAVDSALEKCHSMKQSAQEPIQNCIKEFMKNDTLITTESFELSSGSLERSPLHNRSNLISRPSVARSRRRLGISGLKQINIPQEKLDKAKTLFDESDDMHGNRLLTPNKASLRIFNSTPIKVTPTRIQPSVHASTPVGCQKNENMNFDMTPIKPTAKAFDFTSSPIVFQEKSCMDFKRLQENLDSEYTTLRKRLFVIEERKSVLEKQIIVIANRCGSHTRQKMGVLMQSKRNCTERVPLAKLFNSGDDSLNYFRVAQYIFDISPRNSGQVHFNIETTENVTVLTTLDDGVIIPNSHNMVGVTELENALKAMPGVDPNLIPTGWVQNHYKWIVWKLASYERKFPQYFNGSLSIENIMQQLKYRYEREIDKAERSAIRRILEKDDVPQKRLVLCVSDVIQIYNNKFELELTDGWYAARTSIDAPLMQQIYTSKIKIGTKIIIQGAELLNCEGCHPLEVPDNVRLRISFNSSRRAAWHLKLGYYKYPQPFAIKLRTVHPDGGLIGCLKMYIARVYPLRYMEDLNNIKVWRNAKAEEKRSVEFETERLKQIDAIKYKVLREYESEVQEVAKIKPKKMDFSKITCPKTLYHYVQCTNDPDKIMGHLSPSQKKSVFEYKQNAGLLRQQEISSRISQEIEALNLTKRNSTPMLKLLIMDAIDKNEKAFVFNIWRPIEEHLQLLKEETSLTVYNVSTKKTGDLQSTNKTYFKLDNIPSQVRKTQRQLLPIAMTVDCYYKPLFNEFDTVGLIVQITINNYDQDLWLSDFVGRLLFVKITDGTKICSLLDNLKRGQTVALSNLVLHSPQNGFGQAIANQYSVISQYPQHKYLQNGLEMFTQQLAEDTSKLLSSCDDNIEKFRIEVDFRSNYSYRNHSLLQQLPSYNDILEDSSEENSSIIPSRLTMTDVAMSLIDTDQFL